MNHPRQYVRSLYASYPKEVYPFVLASLVNSIGSALMWPLTTIYVHNILHRSYGEAGLVLLFQSLAGIVGQVVGGSLFHRLGARRLIVGSLALTALGQFALIPAKSWYPYIIVMAINGFLFAVTQPAVNAFIGFRWRGQQARLFNLVYVSNNAGVAIGTAAAGVLATISFNLTFAANGVSTVAFAVFFYLFMRKVRLDVEDPGVEGRLSGAENQTAWWLLARLRVYLFLGLGSTMIYLCTSAWSSGVAPYINSHGMSITLYSLLWTVNGLVILFGQPITTMIIRLFARGLPARLVASSLLYLAGFSLMWIFHGVFLDFIFGMILGTFGEMLINPTVPALISQTTGRAAPFYLGVVGGFGSFGRLVGPVLFGNMYDVAGLTPILLVTMCGTAIAAVLFYVHAVLSRKIRLDLSTHPQSPPLVET